MFGLEEGEAYLGMDPEDKKRPQALAFLDFLSARLEGDEEAAGALKALEGELSRLAELEDVLSRKNRDLEDFARLVVHDIKGGLAAVEGFSKLALDACRNGDREMTEECISHALQAARRLDDLVENLYRAGRAGFRETAPEEVDLGLITQDIYRELVAAHGQAMELVLTELPRVRCEPFKIRLVMGNLLNNAFRFRDGGKERCWVRVSASEEGGWVTVRVEDNGVGFPEEKAESLFRPFFRLDEERGGYGLGLLSVRRAVESWGGRVWAEGRPGVGSTFYFTVPAA